MNRPGLLLVLAAAVAWLSDALTKAWAESALLIHTPISLFGELVRLTLGYNPGVAFGMFSRGGPGVVLLNGAVLLLLLGWVALSLRSGSFSRRAAAAVGLLLGGALANFADRLADGRVTDFIDVGIGAARWPTFNLADAFIVIGAFVLALSMGRAEAPDEADAETTTQPTRTPFEAGPTTTAREAVRRAGAVSGFLRK